MINVTAIGAYRHQTKVRIAHLRRSLNNWGDRLIVFHLQLGVRGVGVMNLIIHTANEIVALAQAGQRLQQCQVSWGIE